MLKSTSVIINVTGGPDLSLMEVSDASTIVQEAADEDANIIFGAVVDPALKGKVKITVIATGFDPVALARTGSGSAQTPVDMTPYTDETRRRAEPAATPSSAERTGSRLSIARRSIVDLSTAAPSGAGTARTAAPAAGEGSIGEPHADFGMNATFDVPAFLRRQEG